jgi:hypothetical protein
MSSRDHLDFRWLILLVKSLLETICYYYVVLISAAYFVLVSFTILESIHVFLKGNHMATC